MKTLFLGGALLVACGDDPARRHPAASDDPTAPPLDATRNVQDEAVANLTGDFVHERVAAVEDVTGDGVPDLLVPIRVGAIGYVIEVVSGAALLAGDEDWQGTASAAELTGFRSAIDAGAVVADVRRGPDDELVVLQADGLFIADLPLSGTLDVEVDPVVLQSYENNGMIAVVDLDRDRLVVNGTYEGAPEAWEFDLPLPDVLDESTTIARVRSSYWNAVQSYRDVGIPGSRVKDQITFWPDSGGVTALYDVWGEVNLALAVPGAGVFRIEGTPRVVGLGTGGQAVSRYAWEGCHPTTGACALLLASAEQLTGFFDAGAAWEVADAAIVHLGAISTSLAVLADYDGEGGQDVIFAPASGSDWWVVDGQMTGVWSSTAFGPGILDRWQTEFDGAERVLTMDFGGTSLDDLVFVGKSDISLVVR